MIAAQVPERLEYLLGQHPLQYGFRAGQRTAVYEPGDDKTVGERYNRCPECEQWSPCTVRITVAALLDATRAFAQYAEQRNEIPDDVVRGLADGFLQNAQLTARAMTPPAAPRTLEDE